MSLRNVCLSVLILFAVSGCAHKASKDHNCAGGKDASHKCEGGHCATEEKSEKSGCADCKGHSH